MIRAADARDAEAIARIYNHYIATATATFEEDPVTGAEMARRMNAVAASSLPWLVAEENARIVGYAYASKWKERSGYRYAVEVSVYLDPDATGRGLGSALYGVLFPALRERKIHAVIGGIALPNPASIALHETFGMQQVAHFKETGRKFDRWVDVGYWEGLL